MRRVAADSTSADREAALADLQMAIQHEKPDNPVLAQDHTNRGQLLYRDERFEDALEESKLALRILPDYVDAHVIADPGLAEAEAFRRSDPLVRRRPREGKKSALLYELRALAQCQA